MSAAASFVATRTKAIARITEAISSKLDLFGLSEYDWTPKTRDDTPSMYLYELINWLTTVVDSLALKDIYKEEAYRGAMSYIASCFLVCSLRMTCGGTRLLMRSYTRTSSLAETSQC